MRVEANEDGEYDFEEGKISVRRGENGEWQSVTGNELVIRAPVEGGEDLLFKITIDPSRETFTTYVGHVRAFGGAQASSSHVGTGGSRDSYPTDNAHTHGAPPPEGSVESTPEGTPKAGHYSNPHSDVKLDENGLPEVPQSLLAQAKNNEDQFFYYTDEQGRMWRLASVEDDRGNQYYITQRQGEDGKWIEDEAYLMTSQHIQQEGWVKIWADMENGEGWQIDIWDNGSNGNGRSMRIHFNQENGDINFSMGNGTHKRGWQTYSGQGWTSILDPNGVAGESNGGSTGYTAHTVHPKDTQPQGLLNRPPESSNSSGANDGSSSTGETPEDKRAQLLKTYLENINDEIDSLANQNQIKIIKLQQGLSNLNLLVTLMTNTLKGLYDANQGVARNL